MLIKKFCRAGWDTGNLRFPLDVTYHRCPQITTLMDTFMMATFGITGLVVLANVLLRRMQRHGKDTLIDRIDDIGVWAYPLVYIGGGFLMFLIFYTQN